MSKVAGQPKKNHNAGWKARAQQLRREAAEARQRAYDSLPVTEKVKRNSEKVRAKLRGATHEDR